MTPAQARREALEEAARVCDRERQAAIESGITLVPAVLELIALRIRAIAQAEESHQSAAEAAAPASAVEEVRAFGDRPLDDVADALIGWSEIANRHAAELDRLRAEREAGVWVPREPTEEMKLAGAKRMYAIGDQHSFTVAEETYKAMLTAAKERT